MNEITAITVCTCGSADFNNIQETEINCDTVVSILMVIS